MIYKEGRKERWKGGSGGGRVEVKNLNFHRGRKNFEKVGFSLPPPPPVFHLL